MISIVRAADTTIFNFQLFIFNSPKGVLYMKVTVKKKDNSIPVVITTEFIKLQDAMKFANIVYSGGEAKQIILDGAVEVNGEVCTMRGKKLREGDKFTFDGQTYLITYHS